MTATGGLPAGSPISPPADFPVMWPEPGDARLFWERERLHFPHSVTPMDAALIDIIANEGFATAARTYELPLVEARAIVINTYVFQSLVPFAGSPAAIDERSARAETNIRAAIARLSVLWEDEVLPELREHLAWWDAFDLAHADSAALADHLGESFARMRRLFELHFLVILPAYVAVNEFDDLCRAVLECPDELDGLRMLQGLPNRTIEGGQALWRLSRRALADPEVRAVLEREAAADVPRALGTSDAGRAFLADLRAHLDRYGRRGDGWTISTPSWIEDPRPAIITIKDMLTRPDGEAPAVVTRAAADASDDAVERARTELAGYPEPVREQFERTLEAARVAAPITEDHTFYIDFGATYALRRVLLEVGDRLVASGALATRDDVFLLDPGEVLDALLATASESLRATVAERAAELERWRAVTPPLTLGTVRSEPLPDDLVTRWIEKFYGLSPAPTQAPGELHGTPGSGGVAAGTARVIHSLADAARLAAGDILVAETTAPPWTPLFAIAAAVVTDTGGVLSHCAVVAREYVIPAVVGTGTATAVIRDGQEIEVDGDAGIVRLR
jgi:phosphohistidine swiveling domain-containing protein